MAINFLNTVDLNRNSLDNARIQNLGTDPSAANSSVGQIYFNTGIDTLKQYVANDGSGNAGWIEVGATSGVETLTLNNGTYVNVNSSGTAANPVFAPDLNAVNGTSGASERYLTKSNVWAEISTIPGTYSWEFDGNSGTTQTVVSGGTVTFEGGTKITTLASAGRDLEISHDLQTQTDSTSAASPAAGATFTVVDSVTRDTTGHATGLNVKTITLPAAPTVGDGQIDGRTSGLGLSGSMDATANQSGNTTFTVTSDATTAATASTLMYRDSSGYSNVVTPASGDSTTKIATTAFVQAAVTGLLEFKGGFNASTGAIVGGGNLTSGATRVAVAVGDYYVVTVAGDFFGNALTPLTVGDSVIVQTAAVAGASVEGDFIIVQSDTDLATLTTVGIGNVNAATGDDKLGINVVYSAGTAKVGLNIDTGLAEATLPSSPSDIFIPYLDDTSTTNHKVQASDLANKINSSTSKTGTIAAGSLSGTVAHTFGQNTLVQTFDAGSGATVFCDVVRGTTSPFTITATISATQTNAITILVQKIG
jgi:hypothetical protein